MTECTRLSEALLALGCCQVHWHDDDAASPRTSSGSFSCCIPHRGDRRRTEGEKESAASATCRRTCCAGPCRYEFKPSSFRCNPRRTILIVTGAEVMTLERFKSKLVFRSIGLIAQAHGDIWWSIEETLDVYLLEGK